MVNIKKWEVSHLDKDRAAQLAERYAIPFFLAMMIEIRGFAKHMDEILETEIALSDPFLMKDMDRAVERIRNAIDSFERIAVYGDYDADGVTSTSMLYTYLEARGAIAEAALARELGMDVVVTDHHRPQKQLPEAAAVVDAYRKDDLSPFKDFSGAGVVLKLLIALEDGDQEAVLEEFSDLAALGTVGDVVPLLGENRAIVKAGLKLLSQGVRPGVEALFAN